jgi:peptidoglycan/LPS O-acetylase OafA/YrhL
LDTLRLFAAIMVVLSHFSRNLPIVPSGDAEIIFFHQLALAANGQAAVGLFFVISGFCIHFRQSKSLTVDSGVFLCRRVIRIGLPLLAMSALASYLGPWATMALQTVLWSLYCELAYYFVYPALLACRRRWPMPRLLGMTTCTAAVMVLVLPKQAIIGDHGWATAAICYPLWLAGAWLAEQYDFERPRSKAPILAWRAAALAMCWLMADGHIGPIELSASILMASVALFSIGYLPAELAHWNEAGPPAWTEMLGRGSYSLYLVHILPVAFLLQVPFTIPFWAAVVLELAVIMGCTFAVYWLCEATAHQLANSIGRETRSLKVIWRGLRTAR